MADVVGLDGKPLPKKRKQKAHGPLWHDIPGTLRTIAGDVDGGKYGEPTQAVVVLMGNGGGPVIFGLGKDNEVTSTLFALDVAKYYLMEMVVTEMEDDD